MEGDRLLGAFCAQSAGRCGLAARYLPALVQDAAQGVLGHAELLTGGHGELAGNDHKNSSLLQLQHDGRKTRQVHTEDAEYARLMC